MPSKKQKGKNLPPVDPSKFQTDNRMDFRTEGRGTKRTADPPEETAEDSPDKEKNSNTTEQGQDGDGAPPAKISRPAPDGALAACLKLPENWSDSKPPEQIINLYLPVLQAVKQSWGKASTLDEEGATDNQHLEKKIQMFVDKNKELPAKRIEDWKIPWKDLLEIGSKIETLLAESRNKSDKATVDVSNLFELRKKLEDGVQKKGFNLDQVCPDAVMKEIDTLLNDSDKERVDPNDAPEPGRSSRENAPTPESERDDEESDQSSDAPYPGEETAVPSIGEKTLGIHVHIRKSGRGSYRVIVNRGTEGAPLYQIRPASDWGTADEFYGKASTPLSKDGLVQLKKDLRDRSATISACIRANRDKLSHHPRARKVTPPTYILIRGGEGPDKEHWLSKSEFIALKGKRMAEAIIERKLNEQGKIRQWWARKRYEKRHPTEKREMTKEDIKTLPQLSWVLDGQDLPQLDNPFSYKTESYKTEDRDWSIKTEH